MDQELDDEQYGYRSNEFYLQILDVFPLVKISDLSVKAAEKGVSVTHVMEIFWKQVIRLFSSKTSK